MMDEGMGKVTLPYIWRYLSECGLKVKVTDNAVLLSLCFDLGVSITLQEEKFSLAVPLPVCMQDAYMNLELACHTVADSVATRVFLLPDDEDLNLWFSQDCICKTREEFEDRFDGSFKKLLESVRTFIKLRDRIQKVIRTKAFVNGRPN